MLHCHTEEQQEQAFNNSSILVTVLELRYDFVYEF